MLDCLPDHPLCIPPAYEEVTRTAGVLSLDGRDRLAAAYEKRGVKIEHVFTDAPLPPAGWSQDPRSSHDYVCRAGMCVAYRMVCNADTWGLCDLAFMPTPVPEGERPRPEPPAWYVMEAKRPRLLRQLLSEVTLRVGGEQVPLAQLHSGSCGSNSLFADALCPPQTTR